MVNEPPGLGEIIMVRFDSVKDDLSEIKAQLHLFVLREVYLADKAANEARFLRLEQDSTQHKNEKKRRNNMYHATLLATLSTIIAGIILAIVIGTK